MRRAIYLLGLIVFIAACSGTEGKAQTEKKIIESYNELLKPIEFRNRIEVEKNLQLVDVRTPQEFKGGSIPKAINYNLLDGTFEKSLKNLDPKKAVYLYCAKGGRSGKAAIILKKNGFTKIVDLSGGYTAYSKIND